MLIELTTGVPIGRDHTMLISKDIKVVVHSRSSMGKTLVTEKSLQYFTQAPIYSAEANTVGGETGVFDVNSLMRLENEVCGISIEIRDDQLSLLVFSARLSRPRVYFLERHDSIFLSCDIRELLPLSGRVLNKEIAYGIVKFGETPEFHSIVQDVKVVPVGSYLALDNHSLKQVLSSKISISDFRQYHQIKYSQTGGDVQRTKDVLRQALHSLRGYNPGLLVSGGIDSSLLNYLYNEMSSSSYPAFFLDFKEASAEKEYALRSLKKTKAELVCVEITEDNLIENFNDSVGKLIYPVYDNGSAFVGHIFSQTLHKRFGTDLPLIDGTLADSCYGVRDYERPLLRGGYQFEFYSLVKEWIYSRIELGGGVRSTRPRDAYLHDDFLQDLLWYGGVYSNIWFSNAKGYTSSLREKFYWYLNLLDSKHRLEYWPQYTILKMLLYAAKQTTVKVYDMLSPTQVYFPFMFQSVLADQGEYSWKEKSAGGIVKAPLKKLLEDYADSEFIYRKKSGLQSQTRKWINRSDFKIFLMDLLFSNYSVADSLMGRNSRRLQQIYRTDNPPSSILSLVLSLAVLQRWMDINRIKSQ